MVESPPFAPGTEVFVRFCAAGSDLFRNYILEGGFPPALTRFYVADSIHSTQAACERDYTSGFLVTRATLTGESRVSPEGSLVWEFHPVEFTDYPLSALAAYRGGS